MIEGIPRISVLVICYKQEELIKRAINSLLAQKDYIYEICVSDDCSPDRTWEVLQDYDRQNPGLFKLHRNEPNVGIFENIERTWTMPSGDMVYHLSGDDECGEGWLKRVVDFIQQNNIDYKNELFCVYGDYKQVYSSGDVLVKSNKAILRNPDNALRLALRQMINNRSACYSINILRKFEKVSQGRSHIAENIQDRQLQMYSEKNYYIPHVGNLYFSKIGISVHLTEEMKKERMQIWPYTLKVLEEKGITLNKKDQYFIKYRQEFQKVIHWKSKISILKAFYYNILGIDCSLKGSSETLRYYAFALLRRLPHKHVIYFK